MTKENLVLIGMPGSGKSTLGVLVAKTLGMSFVDTDLLIQEQEGQLLQNIINKQGIAAFLKIEAAVILQLKVQNCVIATGGSVIYSNAAIEHLKQNGYLIYIKLSYIEIKRRIHNMASRGIVMNPDQNLYDLYQERVVLYEKQADIVLDCSKLKIEETILQITDKINNKAARDLD